ncbi:hypothetical protein PSGE105469_02010 [Pseudomonas gessardii]
MSSNRIIVDASLQKDFVEAFVERVRQLKVGDPDLADTVIGPLINRRQLEGAVARIEAAKAESIELLLGGAAHG